MQGSTLLGQGAYGKVNVKPGEPDTVYKKFESKTCMLQELGAMNYLQGSKYIVQTKSLNFESNEIAMKRYDGSLRDWIVMAGGNMANDEDKMSVIHDVLCGLVELHDRALVHGDLTPRNIFMTYSPISCVIGDLGFVSISKYAKVEKTAPVYRDPNWNHSYAHDIYSLGIIMIEMFGGEHFRVKDRQSLTPEAVSNAIKTKIADPKMSKLLTKMTSINHVQRPRACEILKQLFDEKLTVYMSDIPEYKEAAVAADQKKRVKSWITKLNSEYHIYRPIRVEQALYIYISKHNRPKEYRLFVAAIATLAVALFGKAECNEACKLDHTKISGFTIGLHAIKGVFNEEQLHHVLRNMVTDRDILDMLLLPS